MNGLSTVLPEISHDLFVSAIHHEFVTEATAEVIGIWSKEVLVGIEIKTLTEEILVSDLGN